MPRTEYRKEKQKDLLTTSLTLLEQYPLLEKRKPVEETSIIDPKKIGPYKLITTEGRKKTPDVLITENKDIRLRTADSY